METRLQELSGVEVVWPSPSLSNGLNLPLVLLPPREFCMSSPASELQRESNENQVDVTISKGYWLGRYEVTKVEYEAVMVKNPSSIKQ